MKSICCNFRKAVKLSSHDYKACWLLWKYFFIEKLLKRTGDMNNKTPLYKSEKRGIHKHSKLFVNPLFYGCFWLFETPQKTSQNHRVSRRTPVDSPVSWMVKYFGIFSALFKRNVYPTSDNKTPTRLLILRFVVQGKIHLKASLTFGKNWTASRNYFINVPPIISLLTVNYNLLI